VHLPGGRVEEVRLLDVFPVTKVDLAAAGNVVDHTLDGSAVLLLGKIKKKILKLILKLSENIFFSNCHHSFFGYNYILAEFENLGYGNIFEKEVLEVFLNITRGSLG
jgi:hypothetical protein